MKEAIQQYNELCRRETLLEEMIDHCLNDIDFCRSRINDLDKQRAEIINSIMETAKLSDDDEFRPQQQRSPTQPAGDEMFKVAQAVSLREMIRRSVCAEPGDYKTIAERLNVKPKQASAQLSRLHHRGAIGKSGSTYGPPDYCDKTVSGRA